MSTQLQKQFNYDEGMKELTNINDVIQKVQKGVQQVTSALEQFGAYNVLLSNELPKLYDKNSIFKNVIMQFSDIFARINVIMNHSNDKIKSCKIYFSDWQQHFDKAKKIKNAHDQAKKKYDHYEQKVEKLRKKQKELASKNKETLKDKQKLERNEIKLQNSQSQYKISSEESLNQIQDVYITRFDNLHNFVTGYMTSIKEMSAKLDDKLSEVHNPKASFDKCRQELLRQKQDQRIKKAIDQDMILIQKATENEKQKNLPPPIPEVSYRRKSIHLEMNQGEQKGPDQNQNIQNQTHNEYNYPQDEPIYGLEYVTNNNGLDNGLTTSNLNKQTSQNNDYRYHDNTNTECQSTNHQNYSSSQYNQSQYSSNIHQNQSSNYYSSMSNKRFSESKNNTQSFNYDQQYKMKSATLYANNSNYYGDNNHSNNFEQEYRFRNDSQNNMNGLSNLNMQHSVSTGAQPSYYGYQSNQQNNTYSNNQQYKHQKSADPFDLLDD